MLMHLTRALQDLTTKVSDYVVALMQQYMIGDVAFNVEIRVDVILVDKLYGRVICSEVNVLIVTCKHTWTYAMALLCCLLQC